MVINFFYFSTSFNVNYKEITRDTTLNTDWPSLKKDLEDAAEMVLGTSFSIFFYFYKNSL